MESDERKIFEPTEHPFVALKHKRVLTDKGSNRVDWHHKIGLFRGVVLREEK